MDKCIIVAAGDLNPVPSKSENSYIMAADAGYLSLKKEGIDPDILIGDWDSSGSVPNAEGAEIITLPHEKDDTDTMMCVKTALARGFREIDIYGATGGDRFDHTLSNLQALNYIAQKGAIGRIHCGKQIITVIDSGRIRLRGKPGDYVSVFACDKEVKGLTISGMLYNVNDVSLTYADPYGTSNELTEEIGYISVRKGLIQIVYPADCQMEYL